jgi:hypothetical protein
LQDPKLRPGIGPRAAQAHCHLGAGNRRVEQVIVEEFAEIEAELNEIYAR